ncbi:retrovirus-related Pol polyprotein from transposon 412 [Trichonephila clavipes]|nr:retrovirus-related Pol polyprotein from transposon 412 [Trichonephila clavipes]
MNYFNMWPESYPIPNQEASTVAEVLVQHWISRFGFPLQLHSDHGRNFNSAVCKRLCEILAINKTMTTALHPQSDGMVERFNRTILNSLSLLVSRVQFTRPPAIPHPTCSLDVIFVCLRIFCSDAPLAPEEYIKKLQPRMEEMEEMHHLARERIGMASEKMKTRTTQEQLDTKATKCGYGIRNVAKDFLRSCRPTGKVLAQF